MEEKKYLKKVYVVYRINRPVGWEDKFGNVTLHIIEKGNSAHISGAARNQIEFNIHEILRHSNRLNIDIVDTCVLESQPLEHLIVI